jgi:hypothetical protein
MLIKNAILNLSAAHDLKNNTAYNVFVQADKDRTTQIINPSIVKCSSLPISKKVLAVTVYNIWRQN